ncbi:MAG: hypothetical protein NTU64_17175, partial [Hyphomicrobiales bacterium]|nr:hypothetical protein [Hyphomicrobiales bacterium]
TVLNWHLARWGFAFNDGKMLTPTTRDMGFREIPRWDYLARLRQVEKNSGRVGRWQIEADVADVADWQPQAKTSAPSFRAARSPGRPAGFPRTTN